MKLIASIFAIVALTAVSAHACPQEVCNQRIVQRQQFVKRQFVQKQRFVERQFVQPQYVYVQPQPVIVEKQVFVEKQPIVVEKQIIVERQEAPAYYAQQQIVEKQVLVEKQRAAPLRNFLHRGKSVRVERSVQRLSY